MSMTITYQLGNALYINITNRCTNQCAFCVRNQPDDFSPGIDLWLEREPSVNEILADIRQRDPAEYKEFVFCGYGEPMMRAYELIELCKQLKMSYHKPIRINTNGQGNLICGEDITPLLKGLVDAVSISLNARNAQTYQKLCLSEFGEKAFAALLDFTAKAQKYVPKVALTVVDVMSQADITACKAIARKIGVDFRVRHCAR